MFLLLQYLPTIIIIIIGIFVYKYRLKKKIKEKEIEFEDKIFDENYLNKIIIYLEKDEFNSELIDYCQEYYESHYK